MSHGGPVLPSVRPSVCLSNSDLVSETRLFSGFSKISVWVPNTSCRARESFVKIGLVTLYVRAEINLCPIFHISWLIWVKFDVERLHVLTHSDSKFRENRCSESHNIGLLIFIEEMLLSTTFYFVLAHRRTNMKHSAWWWRVSWKSAQWRHISLDKLNVFLPVVCKFIVQFP
jgi:hypothetical protein